MPPISMKTFRTYRDLAGNRIARIVERNTSRQNSFGCTMFRTDGGINYMDKTTYCFNKPVIRVFSVEPDGTAEQKMIDIATGKTKTVVGSLSSWVSGFFK